MTTALARKGIWKNNVAEIISDFGISQSVFARLIDAPETTVFRWIKGVSSPQKAYQERITKLVSIHCRLCDIFEREEISKWLNDPLKFLGGKTPLEAIRRGEYEKVQQLFVLLEGEVYI